MEDAVSTLDHVLSELDIRAEPFALCALEGACSLGLGRNPGATLHYVLGGTGQLRLTGHAPLALAPGRLLLVPAAANHGLFNEGGPPTAPPACRPAGLDLEEHIARGAGTGRMVVLCSRVTLSLRNTHGLIDLLRDPLDLDLHANPGARRAMEALLHEMGRPRMGRRAMVRVLLLQCMIDLLRAWLEAGDVRLSWLRGLDDPGLWHSLHAMLDDPGAPHSLQSLAAAAGMSRSRFAERFQAAYGRPPMAFLRALRLSRAAKLLSAGRVPVKRVAQEVGFSSRSAFTRAFVGAWGASPRAFRGRRDASEP